MNKYLKAIGALAIGLIGWATAVTNSDAASVTSAEWVGFATVFATVFTVWIVPNQDPIPPPHD